MLQSVKIIRIFDNLYAAFCANKVGTQLMLVQFLKVTDLLARILYEKSLKVTSEKISPYNTKIKTAKSNIFLADVTTCNYYITRILIYLLLTKKYIPNYLNFAYF